MQNEEEETTPRTKPSPIPEPSIEIIEIPAMDTPETDRATQDATEEPPILEMASSDGKSSMKFGKA